MYITRDIKNFPVLNTQSEFIDNENMITKFINSDIDSTKVTMTDVSKKTMDFLFFEQETPFAVKEQEV